MIEREREEAVFLTITKPAEFHREGVGSHRRKSLDRLSFASQRRPEVDIPSLSGPYNGDFDSALLHD